MKSGKKTQNIGTRMYSWKKFVGTYHDVKNLNIYYAKLIKFYNDIAKIACSCHIMKFDDVFLENNL